VLLRHRSGAPRGVRADDAHDPQAGRLAAGVLLPAAAPRSSPPFPVSELEVRRLFAPKFRIERAYPPRSVRLRQGQEWMVLFRRVNAPA